MALVQIPNQPVVLNPEADCVDCDTRVYCQKYGPDDTLNWQAKQTPCGTVDPCPEYIVGSELGENFNLAIADCDEWDLGAGWGCSVDGICHTPGSTNLLSENLNTPTVAGKLYRIQYTIQNSTAGAVKFKWAGGFESEYISGNTLLDKVFILAGIGGDTTIDILPTSDFDGCIQFCSVKEVANFGWETIDWVQWTIGEDCTFCHSGDDSIAELSNDTLGINDGGYYAVKVKITGSATATTIIYLHDNPSETFTGSGEYTFYITAGSTGDDIRIQIIGDACIQFLEIAKLKNDYGAALIDSETGALVADISGEIGYYQDWVTIAKKWSELAVGYGCYKLAIYGDCCTDCVPSEECGGLCNLDFSTNDCWVLTTSGNVSSAINSFVIPDVWDIFFNDTNPAIATIKQELTDFCKNRRYEFSFGYDSAAPFGYGVNIINSNGDVLAISQGSKTAGSGTASGTISLCTQKTYEGPFFLLINIISGGTSGEVQIDNVSYQILAFDMNTDCPDFVSNCLSYRSSVSCDDKLVMGYADNSAYGFEFINTGFRLQARVSFALRNSSSDADETQYIFSNGDREKGYTRKERLKTMMISQVDEITHDVVDTARLLKHFYLGNNNDVLTEYVAKKGEYVREWKGIINTCNAKLEVAKKGDIGFMTNC